MDSEQVNLRKWPNPWPDWKALDGTVYWWCDACHKWHSEIERYMARAIREAREAKEEK